jgi:sugar phosphate permease
MTEDDHEESDLPWRFLIGSSMCLGYAALMLCRTTVSIAGPALLLDDDLQLTKTTFGMILGWGMAGNLAGKLTNGILSDKTGGPRVFIYALGLSAAAIGLFGAASEIKAFCLLYFITLFAKSAGWPAIAAMIGSWFPTHTHGRMWGFISTSSRASSLGSTLLLSSLLYFVSWRWLPFIAAGITICVAGLLSKYLLTQPPDTAARKEPRPSTSDPDPDAEHPLDNLEWRDALIVFVKLPRFWLISLGLMSLAVLFEFQVFIPIYLHESLGLSPAQAGTASSIFPAGCLLAVLTGGLVYDKLTKKVLPLVLGGMLAMSTASLTFLWALPRFEFGHQAQSISTGVAILIFGFSIAPAYYIPMGVFSIDFGGKHRGFLIGLIDALAYAGVIVFDFVGGSVADQADGWASFLAILFGISVVATVTMTLFLWADYRASETAWLYPRKNAHQS